MSKASLIPFNNNILCKPVDAQGKSTGGIIVPEAHRVPPSQGVVVDKGPTCSEAVHIGDTVFFAQHTETRITWAGNSYIVVPEHQVLGVIRPIEDEPAASAPVIK